MSLRLELFDNRNPAAWTRADRKRFETPGLERAVVSSLWPSSPAGLAAVDVLPHVQPGVWRKDGVPVGAPGTFNADWGAVVDQNPEWSLVDGTPLHIWGGPVGQGVTAVDLTRLDVIERLVQELVWHFPWAQGLHLDYFTNLGWLRPAAPAALWRSWDMGLALLTQLLRTRQPGWILQGQQYHLTPITSYVDGLFVERVVEPEGGGSGPRWMSLAEHVREAERHGRIEDWAFEVRYPTAVELPHREAVVAMVRDPGALLGRPGQLNSPLLSWGFGAQALVGVPS